MPKKHETQPQAIGRRIAEEHAKADQETLARLNLDIKGSSADVFKAAVEKVIPHRVKIGVAPDGSRSQEIVSNRDREPGK